MQIMYLARFMPESLYDLTSRLGGGGFCLSAETVGLIMAFL